MSPMVWGQYLDAAARAAGVAPSGGYDPDSEGSSFAKQTGAQKKPAAKPPAPKGGARKGVGGGRTEKGATGARPVKPEVQAVQNERTDLREIVTAVSQRMESLARRLPASEMRSALDATVTRMRAMPAIGGGPGAPRPTRPERKNPGSPPETCPRAAARRTCTPRR